MRLSGGFGKAYKEQGVDKFYEQKGQTYQNPHRYDIQRILRIYLKSQNQWIGYTSKILDLACGSGQVTVPLISYGYMNIKGTDPYTFMTYSKNTKKQCDKFSFLDILQGCYEEQKFQCIICSYAMHLVKQDMLHDFCFKLSEMAKWLIIISPHKLPILKEDYGWFEQVHKIQDKIHFRVFKSLNYYSKQDQELQKELFGDEQCEEEEMTKKFDDECKKEDKKERDVQMKQEEEKKEQEEERKEQGQILKDQKGDNKQEKQVSNRQELQKKQKCNEHKLKENQKIVIEVSDEEFFKKYKKARTQQLKKRQYKPVKTENKLYGHFQEKSSDQ